MKLDMILPDFAKFPNRDFRVKKADYFTSDSNIWDRKSHSSDK